MIEILNDFAESIIITLKKISIVKMVMNGFNMNIQTYTCSMESLPNMPACLMD